MLRRFQQKEAFENRHKRRLQEKIPPSPGSALLCRLFQTISFLFPAYRDILEERKEAITMRAFKKILSLALPLLLAAALFVYIKEWNPFHKE